MRLKGHHAIERGQAVPVTGPSVPFIGPSLPHAGHRFPLRGPFYHAHTLKYRRRILFLPGKAELDTSGKKKQHKRKLFGPDFPRTFLTLTPGCPGVKKFLPITGATEKCTFWCGHPRFSVRTSMARRVLEKLCTKNACVDFLAPTTVS